MEPSASDIGRGCRRCLAVRVVLSGAGGFVGTAVWAWLAHRGHDVVPVDLVGEDSPIVNERLKRLGLDGGALIRRDICDVAAEVMSGSDVVVALAGLGGARGTDVALYHRRNVATVAATLAAVDPTPPSAVLFASSSSVYGTAPAPHDEATFPQPTHLYAASKLAAEWLARGFSTACPGSSVTALRLFTVYGPGQRPDMMFAKLLGEREAPLFGDGTHRRSFSFIDDVASAIGRLATEVTVEPGFHVVNVGNPQSRSLLEAIEILDRLGAARAGLRASCSPVAEPPVTQATDDILSALLGEKMTWTPLEEGLRRQLMQTASPARMEEERA